jgi:hypothetical protein
MKDLKHDLFEPKISLDDTRPSRTIIEEPRVISTRTNKFRINKKAVAIGTSVIIGGAIIVDVTANAIKNRLNWHPGVSQTTGQTSTEEPILTPSPTGTPDNSLLIQEGIDGSLTAIFEATQADNASNTPVEPTSDRQMANPDIGEIPTETATATSTVEPTQTPTPSPTETEVEPTVPVFTFYQTSRDAVGDNPVEVNSIVPGGITSAEDGHVLDLKSITLATFVFNGTGYGLNDKDLHRLATSRAFLETQYGISGKVNADTFQIYSNAPSQMFNINGINFITNSDSYARGSGVDENGQLTSVEIYQTESENSYIDEVAVKDNTGIAFVVPGSDVRDHGFITYEITDANGKVTRLSVDKMCGNVVAENGTMVYPTAGATVTLQNTPTPIYFTPTYPSSTYTPPAITETSTPMLTVTPIPTQPEASDTPRPTDTQRPPTATPPPTNTETIPTATQYVPTSTSIPRATETEVPPATNTPVPPTNVPPTAPRPTPPPTNEDTIPTATPS